MIFYYLRNDTVLSPSSVDNSLNDRRNNVVRYIIYTHPPKVSHGIYHCYRLLYCYHNLVK